MLRPKNMKNVLIAAPKTYQSRIISRLYSMKVLHITEHFKTEDLDIGKSLQNAELLSETLVKIRSLKSYLKAYSTASNPAVKKEKSDSKAKKPTYQFSAKQVANQVNMLYDEITKVINSLNDAEQGIRKNNNINSKLNILKKLGISPDNLGEYGNIAWFVGFVDKPAELSHEIRKLTTRIYVKSTLTENKNIIAIFVDARLRKEIAMSLEKYKFQSIDFSDIILTGKQGTFNVQSFETALKNLQDKKTRLQSKLSHFAMKHQKYLQYAEKFVAVELEKAESPLKFGSTDEAFVVTGWVPEGNVEAMVKEIRKSANDKVYIEVKELDYHHDYDDGHEHYTKKDDAPILLDNPKAVKPFELLLHLFSLPKFKEIDPTFFIFLAFPFFFGFMLGDFGYGLVSLILFLALKKAMPQFKQFFDILVLASLVTIIFGFVFGEFFGAEELFGFEFPRLLSRSHQIMDLLLLAVAIGIVHVNLGLMIGFVNELHHGFWKAVFAKLSWILLEIAIAVGYFASVQYGVGLGAIAVIMLWKAEGVKGLIELPSLFSNILSYARLMALGVASVKLAEVINHFASEFFAHGGISIFYGVLLLVVGHTINIALGVIGPFLHSLRLHYVEFFTKFFIGGGKNYRPFGAGIEPDAT